MARKDDMEALVSKKPSPHEGGGGKAKGKASTAGHKALITRNLRMAFGEVASEPVPQRFLDLLQQIGDAEEKKS
jgi:hypothetical protein